MLRADKVARIEKFHREICFIRLAKIGAHIFFFSRLSYDRRGPEWTKFLYCHHRRIASDRSESNREKTTLSKNCTHSYAPPYIVRERVAVVVVVVVVIFFFLRVFYLAHNFVPPIEFYAHQILRALINKLTYLGTLSNIIIVRKQRV